MGDKEMSTNAVSLAGEIFSPLEFSHEIYGEGFYVFHIRVPRLSEYNDILPVTVSERLIVGMDLKPGDMIKITGQLRSYNKYVNEGNRLILTVFVQDIFLCEKDENIKNPNQIVLDGYICKPPAYRSTPFGREITDILLAVNRPYNKSDYIPCIAWGRNARYSEKLKVGDHIKIWGRIQSREYQKKISEEKTVTKVAYEVSISKMEVYENENNRQKNQ
ncbi:MAG TPA: single-stranded DNA-binding protein [Clostridiales bacterium]|nr:single-stranded DNA-binding protein [Clostridiales bacterium]